MRLECWITKAKDTHSEYVILIAVTQQIQLRGARQCYVMRILPDLLMIVTIIASIQAKFSRLPYTYCWLANITEGIRNVFFHKCPQHIQKLTKEYLMFSLSACT